MDITNPILDGLGTSLGHTAFCHHFDDVVLKSVAALEMDTTQRSRGMPNMK